MDPMALADMARWQNEPIGRTSGTIRDRTCGAKSVAIGPWRAAPVIVGRTTSMGADSFRTPAWVLPC